MAKRNSLYVITADAANGLVTVVAGSKKVVVDSSALPESIRIQAMVHGLKQKIGDAGAVEADEKTGKVDEATKIQRVFDMAERLNRGVWSERAAAGTSEDMVLFRALVLAYPDKSGEQLTRYMEGLNVAQKRVLVNQVENNPIKVYIDKVRAELASSAPVDAENLLQGLAI